LIYYRVSYPIYGQNIHEMTSKNRVVMHDPYDLRRGKDVMSSKSKMYSPSKAEVFSSISRKSAEMVEA
jgi:hypothetical protein